MPSLTPEERARLLGPLDVPCRGCGAIRIRHYCRVHDEFWIACGCPSRDETHDTCARVYVWTPMGVRAIPDFDELLR
jgi:hypothetical protein